MTSIVQDINFVRALRKDLRDLTVSSDIRNSIELIHNCIRKSSDTQGWRKVDWRGNARGGGGGNSGGHGYHRGGGGGLFEGRQSRGSESPSTIAFTSRSKGSGNDSGGGCTPVEATESASTAAPVTAPCVADGFRQAMPKYVSKFKKSEKVEDTILNTIVLGKLNKFSEQNYGEIKEFITYIIDSGQTDMIKCFMKLVFEKAASEEMFCPLYAKLLSELSTSYPILLTEMANLYAEYMEIFEDIVDAGAENYNEVCKRNIEKKYRRGYSQFLAELIKHSVIVTETFMKIVTKIMSQVEANLTKKDAAKQNEEYADCLMKIMKAIQINKEKDTRDTMTTIENIRKTLKEQMAERIQPLTVRNPDSVGLSNKARFTLLDIYENIGSF